MLNSNTLNSVELNGTGYPIYGEGALIVLKQQVVIEGAGEEVDIQQLVGFIGSGNECGVEQTVDLYMGGTGNFIDIEQSVTVTGLGSVAGIEQRVISNVTKNHLQRVGWDAYITIAGENVDTNKIHGNITVERSEGLASLATFTIIPELGVQDVEAYAGKAVTIDVTTPRGTKRIYTGLIDIPEIDLIQKKITFRCTDRRAELINSQFTTAVSTIGYYSPLVFQDVKDTADELEKRLSTTPQSVDFDAYGAYTITSWYPKATADYTLTDSDIYYSQPRVELASRASIVNRVNINFQYRYERLHHTERTFSWTSPVASNIFLFLTSGYSLTRKDDIMSAINGAGWPVRGSVSFTAMWPSGWYGGIAWSTVSYTAASTVKIDPFTGNPVLDSDGNEIVETRVTGGTNYNDVYCMGATWVGTYRWAQTITENYSLAIVATQSVTQYGTIAESEQYSLDSGTDGAEWENYKAYTDTGNGTGNYYIDKDVNRTDFNNAVATAMQKAKTTILASHRDTKVSASRSIWPEIDLKHTVAINTTPVTAKGKVFSIYHSLNISTGEAKTDFSISLFKAQGSGSDSSLALPALTENTPNPGTGTITLGNHFGQDPTVAAAASWNGMIGNKINYGTLGRTQYPESFIVDVPAIPEDVRQEKNIYASASYTIAIPNDDLDIEF